MDPLEDVELYRGLERTLGADVAGALMLRLPPQPVHELATKQDVRDLQRATREDISTLRQEMSEDISTLRQEMSEDISDLRQEMRGEMRGLETRFDEKLTLRLSETENRILAVIRGEMIAAIHAQGRQLALTLLGAMVGLSTLAYAIAHV